MTTSDGDASGSPADSLIALEGIRYRHSGPPAFSLSLPGFAMARGERVLLIGASGSGKSTFLSLLCGILRPETGTIRVDGVDLQSLPPARHDRFRGERFGIVFQMFNLLPFASVADNILLPLAFAPARRARVAEAGGPAAELARLLARLDLPADLARRRAAALSVGQQQRVAAARALIGTPPLILADEPTSALDPASRDRFLDLLFAETAASGAGLLAVSHDPALADRFDRTLAMEDLARTETGS